MKSEERLWPPQHVSLKAVLDRLHDDEQRLAVTASELFAATGRVSPELAQARHLIQQVRESLLINWEPQ